MEILCSIKQQELRIENACSVSKTRGYIFCRFSFEGEEWADTVRTAYFKRPETGEVYPAVLNGDLCEVPWEALSGHGYVYLSVSGEREGYRITTNNGSFYNGDTICLEEPAQPPTPDIYDQMLGIMLETNAVAQSVRSDADDGKFDGFSPSVTLTRQEDGVEITVHNEDGDVTEKVHDGADYEHSDEFQELAEQISMDRKAVEKSKESVDSTTEQFQAFAKESVKAVQDAGEAKVKEIETAAEQGTEDVNNAKNRAVEEVNTAGTTQKETVAEIGTNQAQLVVQAGTGQLDEIAEKGQEQAAAVNAAGETQVQAVQAEGQAQINAINEAGGGVENALSNYFALRRTGKVFTTKLYKYETSTSPAGVKMHANENMVCEPSVGMQEGRDDYAQYGLFQHFTCNFSVDENGFNHVDALEGQKGFSKYGKVQVGEVTMSGWFGIEDTEDAVLYHYSDKQTELTPHPMKESINPDGTLSPFMIHAKYAAGDIEGAPYSSKGLAPASGCQAAQAKNPVSYTGMIAYMHKLGGHYCGTTSWDLFYRQLMMIIKYATSHSQSIMAGCTSYSYQYNNLVEETGVSRVILTKAQAAGFVEGSYVSIGEMGEATSKDRNQAYMHNLAYSVRIRKIEDVDGENTAIYVDAPEAFDTTLTTCISTMPWRSGSTDEVAGSDGSPGNNTNGKYPFKIQGIETGIGAYEVLGNVVMDIVTGEDENPVRDVYVCEDASALSSAIATVRENYKKAAAQVPYTAAQWKYITEEMTDADLGLMIPTGLGGGSATGFADGLYTDAGTSGQREWLALGGLSAGMFSGLWLLFANYGLSFADWFIVSGVSPNGTRGEWQAAA